MSNKIKILLISDLHLGIESDKIHISHQQRERTFKRIINISGNHDLLLIAGDLIDNRDINREIIELVKNEFTRLREMDTKIIYTPGLGEVSDNGDIHPFIKEFNVNHLFDNNNWSKSYQFEKNSEKIYIYGAPALSECNIPEVSKESSEGFHIGLYHINFNPMSLDQPLNIFTLKKNDIKSLGLDFYSLGYNHNFKMFKIFDKILGAYSGSAEATSFKEQGDRYIISIEIENGKISQFKRLMINSVKLLNMEIDCSNFSSIESLKETILESRGKNVNIKVILQGIVNFEFNIDDMNNLKSEFNWLEIIDDTSLYYELLIKKYFDEKSLRGNFYKILNENIIEKNLLKDITKNELSKILKNINNSEFDDLEVMLCDYADV